MFFNSEKNLTGQKLAKNVLNPIGYTKRTRNERKTRRNGDAEMGRHKTRWGDKEIGGHGETEMKK